METSQGAQPTATTTAPVATPVFASFSDLEAAMSAKPETPEAKEPETPKELPEDPKEAKEAILKELKGEDEKEAVEKDAKDKPGTKAKETDKNKVRTFKFKHGESEFDLSPESMVDVKVDGKLESHKLQDLIDNFSAKTNWSRKYQELHQERTSLQDVVNRLHNEFVQKGDPFTAIEVLAEAIGADPLKVRKELTQGLLKQADSLASLSPEEREVAQLREELNWRQRREESERTKAETQKVTADLNARLDKVQETFGYTREQLAKAYEDVKDHVPKDQLTPEFLGDYLKFQETRAGVTGLLDEVEAEFDSREQKQGAIEKLEKVLRLYPDMTLSELRDYAAEAWGSKAAKNISKKLKKTRPTNTARSEERAKEPLTFDDID
jgi:uncharacterized membrane protein